MKIAVYPGSFDPVTNGHIDILERTSKIFDRVVVAVIHNITKQALFTLDERVDFIKESVGHLPNVEVESFSGLLADYLKEKKANVIIRGLRTMTDFEYESHVSMMNKHLLPEIDTIFVMADSKYIFVSSSGIKEASLLGGKIGDMVPPIVEAGLKQKVEDFKKSKA